MLIGCDVSVEEVERIGLVFCQVFDEQLLDVCYVIVVWMVGFLWLGIELIKCMLWSGLDVVSLEVYMQVEGLGQFFVWLFIVNFEEVVVVWVEQWVLVFIDDM